MGVGLVVVERWRKRGSEKLVLKNEVQTSSRGRKRRASGFPAQSESGHWVRSLAGSVLFLPDQDDDSHVPTGLPRKSTPPILKSLKKKKKKKKKCQSLARVWLWNWSSVSAKLIVLRLRRDHTGNVLVKRALAYRQSVWG
ncbi:hypothetical protein BVC80_717g25 [Macleaya cordata]|uniref:Uncharacterized protein n=1 Tax=Macleaya cordata TaxID=56857 RepID=A0A200PM66_MACCD|nr:hypothetical protein BVC80_717g25 [Macleaya cordata]